MFGALSGDPSSCGPDPKTWWDNIYASDTYVAYRACLNPNDPYVVSMQKGLVAGALTATGQDVGSSLAAGTQGLLQGLFVMSDGSSINWASVGLVTIGAIVAMKLLKRK